MHLRTSTIQNSFITRKRKFYQEVLSPSGIKTKITGEITRNDYKESSYQIFIIMEEHASENGQKFSKINEGQPVTGTSILHKRKAMLPHI